MPKQRKKKTRVKRRKSHSNLGIFLAIGFVACLALWYIVKEPQIPASQDADAELQQEQAREDNGVQAKSKSRPGTRKGAEAKPKRQDKMAAIKQKAAPAKHQPPPATPIRDLDASIIAAAGQLGIPPKSLKPKKSGSGFIYNIPIDRSQMDLTYANMIFKGLLERAGAALIKGTDAAGKQSLMFRIPGSTRTYTLNLFYDNKAYAGVPKKRNLAIVIDDFGTINGALLEDWLTVDKEVCFAIFPDEVYSHSTAEKAQAQGRETIIHVPMEPLGYPNVNPGKNAIFVHQSPSEIERLLTGFIKQFPYSRGINNHMGSLATTDEGVMRTVMTTLKKHDRYFLDSRTSNVSVAYSTAQKAHIGAYRNDLFLDSPDISAATLEGKIKQLINLSDTKSNIIVISHCHTEAKLQYLKKFISRMKAAGFTLVPLSEIDQYNVPGIL